MFYDLQGLIREIESGKTTEEIIQERLSYLNSEEYQKNMKRSRSQEFIQGFISDDEKVGFGPMTSTYYWVDEKQIFEQVIDSFIRKHLSEIKKINSLPQYSLIKGIRNYFFNSEPNKNSLAIYQEMCKSGMSPEDIRYFFGSCYNKYFLEKKCDDEKSKLEEKMNEYEDKGRIIPIPISAIKGLGIGQCTEMALLSQNLLSFLGYNTFMIEGATLNNDGHRESHHFNFIEKNGKYIVFDSALDFVSLAPKIKTPEELLLFDEMQLEHKTYFSCKKSKIYDDAESRMSLLAAKGESFKTHTMSNLKEIMLSKKIIEKEGEALGE